MNERFEGLSLPQLADLLHDIAVPPAVSMMPQTVGWRILALWALAAGLIVAVHGLLRWRRNRYRREAAAGLRIIEARARSDPAAIAEVGALLKRTAITAYGRARVASLYGSDWATFLAETSRDDARVAAAADELAMVAYRCPGQPATIIAAAERWIRCHRD